MASFSEKFASMTVQDVTLVVLCALGIYLLRVRDNYFLLPTWRKDTDVNLYANHHFPGQDEMLPRPIIADLESDGINEIVMVTNALELQILTFPPGTRFSESLLPHLETKHRSNISVEEDEYGRKSRVIALDAGYLSEFQIKRPNRQQVIIVLMDNWQVLCYDHELSLLWKQKLMDVGRIREDYYVKSAGILVTSQKIAQHDHGTVIVGASYAHNIHGHGPDAEGKVKTKKTIHLPHQSGRIFDTQEDTHTHFSTFALSGSNGTIRWHHLPGDFESHPATATRPGVHWKLELHSSHMHQGEVHWSKYSNNILKALPHSWSDLDDTDFELASLRKTEHSKERRRGSVTMSDFVGLPSEHIMGLAFGGLYPHSCHEHVQNPNALIIHNHNGVEALHLLTGQPLTKIEAQDPRSVYVDVNEDGNLDQVRSFFEEDKCQAQIFNVYPALRMMHSGALCKAHTWSVAMAEMFTNELGVSEDTTVALPPIVVKSVATQSGPLHHLMGRTLPSQRVGYDSIFLTSSGRLTSYGPFGDFNWQAKVPSEWAGIAKLSQDGHMHHREVVEFERIFHPSMTLLSMQVYGDKDSVLILGWNEMTLVDLHDGYILSTHSLPCRPSQKPVLGDFNEDGWTDVIVLCPIGAIGFTLHREPNYVYMTLMSVTVILGILFLSWLCKPVATDEDFEE